jgi:hypothetical protein
MLPLGGSWAETRATFQMPTHTITLMGSAKILIKKSPFALKAG